MKNHQVVHDLYFKTVNTFAKIDVAKIGKIENTWSLWREKEKSPITPALVIRVVGHQVAAVHVCRQLSMRMIK